MSDYVSKIQVADTTYDIKDKNARNSSQVNEQIINVINETVTPKITNLEEKIDKVSNGILSINNIIKPDEDGNVRLNASDVNATPAEHMELESTINKAGHVKLSEGTIQIETKEGESIIPDADSKTAASLYDTQQMGIALNNKIDSTVTGKGFVKSVNQKSPSIQDPNGRVQITGEDIPFSIQDDTNLKTVIESLDNSRVIPNSSETPTEPLVNIQVGDTTYKIQGGGSNVRPNPEETTDTLTSISIDNINYKIEGQTIQVEELPEPSEELLNKIYQYTGEDTETLINGRFYKCVLKEEQYQWEEVKFATDGTLDYNDLENLPKINNTLLSGNKTAETLGLVGIEQGAENKDKILKVNEEGKLELKEEIIGNKVSVSSMGTSTNKVKYITIDNTEYKLAEEGGSSSIAELSDVELDATPSANQVLTYNADNKKWVNAYATGGTTIIPNPETTGDEDNLSSIQIGKDKFKIKTSIAKEIQYNDNNTFFKVNNVQDVIETLAQKTLGTIPTDDSLKYIDRVKSTKIYFDTKITHLYFVCGQNDNEFDGCFVINLIDKSCYQLDIDTDKELYNTYNGIYWTKHSPIISKNTLSKSGNIYTYYWNNDSGNYGTVVVSLNVDNFDISQSYTTNNSWIFSQIKAGFSNGYMSPFKLNIKEEKYGYEDKNGIFHNFTNDIEIIPNPEDISEETEDLISLRINNEDYKINNNASNIDYNNTETAIEATDVQSAIDEIVIKKYLTEEKVVGKWIDGKPIYEKTFSIIGTMLDTGNAANSKYVLENLTTEGTCESLITYNGYFQLESTNGDIVLYDIQTNEVDWDLKNSLASRMSITNGNINVYIVCNSYFKKKNVPINVAIQYTKTTD